MKTINEKELEVMNFWKENQIFEKSLSGNRSDTAADQSLSEGMGTKGESFTFYDGPPFATGMPHYGHILAGTIKDVIPRYQTMNGKSVRRVWGWDCHGLPIENLIEKELNLNSKKEIEEYGVGKFNKKAADSVLMYDKEWKEIVPRLGRWVDMEHAYKTMDYTYTESVWWSWKKLYDKGLAYEGSKMMHICPRCETSLAQSEVNQPGAYQDITDISVTAQFELEEKENDLPVYVLAWTTTPWTLPGNSALAVNKNLEYVKVKTNYGMYATCSYYILAKKLVDNIFKQNKEDKDLLKDFVFETEDIDINKYIGKKYKQLFPINFPELYEAENRDNAFKVWHADFITDDAGTGIAHEAPAYGSEDMDLAQKENIPFVKHVLLNGEFSRLTIESVLDFSDEYFKNGNNNPKDESKKIKILENLKVKKKGDSMSTDVTIIKWLAHNRKLFSKEKIVHSYPHCWRCDTPLLNYATSSWFVDVPKIKDKLIEVNQNIGWTPEHVRDGRFGKWLEGAREWAVSRARYWGAPLPVWKSVGGKVKVIGSLEELATLNKENKEKETFKSLDEVYNSKYIPRDEDGKINLHRPYIDEIKLEIDGEEYVRIRDVFDCWYESGSMPYASLHYPFENMDLFKKNYPANFISEGMDQTRGWFYSMLNLGVGLEVSGAFDDLKSDSQNEAENRKNNFDTPYQNVIVSGLINAADGQKMSKSKKNYTDPMILVEKYGADALRLALINSPLVKGDSINFTDSMIEDVYKKVISKMENVMSLYETYKEETHKLSDEQSAIDKWILVRLSQVIEKSTNGYENYKLDEAVDGIEKFVDDLSNWWLRRSRDRLKGVDGEMEEEQKENQASALYVLREVLATFAKVLAPITPFLSERIYSVAKSHDIEAGDDFESVHLCPWPKSISSIPDEAISVSNKIIKEMEDVRSLITELLEIRTKENIKVRQPLASATFDGSNYNIDAKYFYLIKDEVNVKEVLLGSETKLDINITEELKREGEQRELSREIKDKRKELGLVASDSISLTIDAARAHLLTDAYKKEMKIVWVSLVEGGVVGVERG